LIRFQEQLWWLFFSSTNPPEAAILPFLMCFMILVSLLTEFWNKLIVLFIAFPYFWRASGFPASFPFHFCEPGSFSKGASKHFISSPPCPFNFDESAVVPDVSYFEPPLRQTPPPPDSLPSLGIPKMGPSPYPISFTHAFPHGLAQACSSFPHCSFLSYLFLRLTISSLLF